MRDTSSKVIGLTNYWGLFIGALLSSLVTLLMTRLDEAAAANIVVNSLADNQADDGFCTLREAIINANNDDQSGSADCIAGNTDDTITFAVGGTITLGSVLPNIVSNVTIDGVALSISGNNSNRGVFVVSSVGSLTLYNLSIVNGLNLLGGAIDNRGTLAVANGVFSSNRAGFGGAIFNAGTAIITNSTFAGNSSTGIGGAILNDFFAVLTITNSTFSGNSTDGADGGGIFAHGTLTITGSTFSGNSAGALRGGRGGGVHINNMATITNSTFSHNTARDGGGMSNSFRAMISNSTFSGNSATDGGGGIFNLARATIQNSIIADSPSGGNCSGTTLTDGGNNIDDDGTCSFSVANNSKPNTDPLLDPAELQNNGGLTKTIALCTEVNTPTQGCTGPSPAVNAGNNAVCAAAPVNNIDQRGFVRSVDGDRDGTLICDIGAFDSKAVPPPVINSFVAFAAIPSSFRTISDTSGCPAEFMGKFIFSARLSDEITSPALYDLMAKVTTLTNGNVLLNADGGPRGAGAISTIPQVGDYSDGILNPGEVVDVPFIICLKQMLEFNFLVDVLGVAR